MAKAKKAVKRGSPKTAKSGSVIVSASELAALVGLSPTTISHLAMSGGVVRTAKGRYDRDASLLAYCESLRKAAAGRASPTAEAKAELLRLQVSAAARKDALSAGEVILVADVKLEWQSTARFMRAGVLAATSRISAHLPQLGPADLAVIDRELREALTAISEDRPPGLSN